MEAYGPWPFRGWLAKNPQYDREAVQHGRPIYAGYQLHARSAQAVRSAGYFGHFGTFCARILAEILKKS